MEQIKYDPNPLNDPLKEVIALRVSLERCVRPSTPRSDADDLLYIT